NRLTRTLARPGLAVGVAFALFAVTAPLWPRLHIEFLPSTRNPFVYLQAQAPPGTPLEETLHRLSAFEERLQQLPDVRLVLAEAGEAGPDDVLAALAGAQANNGRLA